jgi:hypothetical protein
VLPGVRFSYSLKKVVSSGTVRQHFLNFRRDPHGHGSFRPSFSSNSLSPWITRNPRFTWLSEGNPLHLWLLGVKGLAGVDVVFHKAPHSRLSAYQSGWIKVLCGLRFQFAEQFARDRGEIRQVLACHRDLGAVCRLIAQSNGFIQDPILFTS